MNGLKVNKVGDYPINLKLNLNIKNINYRYHENKQMDSQKWSSLTLMRFFEGVYVKRIIEAKIDFKQNQ